MHLSSNLRRGRTCVFLLHSHLVFVTKYRRVIFTKKVLNELRKIFDSVCKDFEAVLVEFDGKDDHVHLLVNYPPKVSISSLVNSLKGVSSRLIKKNCFYSKSFMEKQFMASQLLCFKLQRSSIEYLEKVYSKTTTCLRLY